MSLLESIGKFFSAQLVRDRNGARDTWPFLPGKYRVLDASAPVVVTVSAHEQLAADLASLAPSGLCMIAELRSAADIEKLIGNVVSNMAIQHIVSIGPETPLTGAALMVLGGNGGEKSDDDAEVLAQSVRAKVDEARLEALRKRVECIDLRACDDMDKILARIGELAAGAKRPNTGFVVPQKSEAEIERIIVAENSQYKPQQDKGGDFRIRVDGRSIIVEHYGPKGRLRRTIEGVNARDICLTLIRNGWVSKLDHAAYLGGELTRAEMALQRGESFLQRIGQPLESK